MAKAARAKKADEAPDNDYEEEGAGFEEGQGSEGQEGHLIVDLTDVEEVKYEAIPRANYPVVVNEVVFEYSQAKGNPMWSWQLEVEEGDYAGRRLFFHTTFNEGGLPRTKQVIARVAPELLEGPFDPEEVAMNGDLVGKRATARVDIRPYQGQKRNNVRDLLAPSDEGSFMDD